MGAQERSRIARVDAWLAQGGTVLAANERAARSISSAFHRERRAEGLSAWPTPAIFAWESWVRDCWLAHNRAGWMLLNSLQEQALWTEIIRNSPMGEGLLHSGLLASASQRAYRLLCEYAPASLAVSARVGWSGDAAIFSEWMAAFDARCRRERLICASRLVAQLTADLREDGGDRNSDGTPLLLVGFDRLLETQRNLLDAFGAWQVDRSAVSALDSDELSLAGRGAQYYAVPDAAAELVACVAWIREKLSVDPAARLLIVTPGLQDRRGELERALLDTPARGSGQDSPEIAFEFSLGVPLGHSGLARAALLLLRWLVEPLTESELDWLFTSGHCVLHVNEELALAETMRRLRRWGQERPEWPLADFMQMAAHHGAPILAWSARLAAARELLAQAPSRQSPMDWADFATELLRTMGWPGFRPLSSVAYQAQRRWETVLEECGSLAFDNSRMEWPEFVSALSAAVAATIFATESSEAPVLVTEPLESAGQLADGIWFLGAHEENWPGSGQPHPLLPIGLQRDAGMPHASPMADWTLAHEATTRLLDSGDEVVFSYPVQTREAEVRPSRLVTQLVGPPKSLPDSLARVVRLERQAPRLEMYADLSRIPFPLAAIEGGAGTLTSQSRCPFQAFATARLGASKWEPSEAGLNARERGKLLHDVLSRIWGGQDQAGRDKGGISSLEELRQIVDLRGFVHGIATTVIQESFTPGRRDSLPNRFPPRFLELEAERLTGLVSEWLAYERERLPFSVVGTEVKEQVTIAGLSLKVRMDRVDQLSDGSRLIIDYKTGDVGPSAWMGERPDDVQLPLYATSAIQDDVGGLVFARIRPAEAKFYGRVRDAATTLRADLDARSAMVKDPLTDEQLEEWWLLIQRLSEDFLAGRAEADPKNGAETCENCHLQAVCRIYENQPLTAAGDSDEEEQAVSEGQDA